MLVFNTLPFQHYVLLYKTFANFALTMVLPFILLVCYNVRIISVLRRRRRLINRPLQVRKTRTHLARFRVNELVCMHSLSRTHEVTFLFKLTRIPEQQYFL